jgi:hypothetical protein
MLENFVKTLGAAALLSGGHAWASESCAAPERSDYQQLVRAADEDATLANGLVAIADHCFDMNNAWTGGANAVPAARGQARPELAGSCQQAVLFCEGAALAVNQNQAVHSLNSKAVLEMQRSYNGKVYSFVEKEALGSPDQAYSCASRDAAGLRLAAANRRAVAQKHLAILKEYEMHHWVWVHSQAASCLDAERAAELKRAKAAADALKQAEREAKAKKLSEEERQRREARVEEARREKTAAEERAAAAKEEAARTRQEDERRKAELREREVKAAALIERAQAAESAAQNALATGKGDATGHTLEAQLYRMSALSERQGFGEASALIQQNAEASANLNRTLEAGGEALVNTVMQIYEERERRQAAEEARLEALNQKAAQLLPVWEKLHAQNQAMGLEPGYRYFSLHSSYSEHRSRNLAFVVENLRAGHANVASSFHNTQFGKGEPGMRAALIADFRAWERYQQRVARVDRERRAMARLHDGVSVLAKGLPASAETLRCAAGGVEFGQPAQRLAAPGVPAEAFASPRWSLSEERLMFSGAQGEPAPTGPAFKQPTLLGELGEAAVVSHQVGEGEPRLSLVSPEGKATNVPLPKTAIPEFSGDQLFATTSALEDGGAGLWKPGLWRLTPGGAPKQILDGTGWASSFGQVRVTSHGLLVAGSDTTPVSTLWLVDPASGSRRVLSQSDFNSASLTVAGGTAVVVEHYTGYESERAADNPPGRILALRLGDGARFYAHELPQALNWLNVTVCGNQLFFSLPEAAGRTLYQAALP